MQARRPLPWCKGPKLEPFRFRDETNRDITFLEHLGSGVHAEVFRVAIDGSIYALKLFRFAHPTALVSPLFLREGLVSIEEVINQNDPFNCECRAYGRLKEVGREDLAVRSYGYILLNQRQEEDVAKLGYDDWDRRDANKTRSIQGIVKEYIPDDGSGPFKYEMLPQMRRDIHDLNRLGIVVWDVRADNYRAGRLVDFSQAHTTPHMELDWNSPFCPRSQVMECCVRDMAMFDDMVAGWNEDNPHRKFWPRFLPSTDFGRRPRNNKRYYCDLWMQEGARFDAAFYDGKEKPRAVCSSSTARQCGIRRKRVSSSGRVRTSTSSAPFTKEKGNIISSKK